MRNPYAIALLVALGLATSACSHTSKVALLSNGDLEGKSLTALPNGPTLTGEDCYHQHYLSKAFEKALKGTPYDTLVDVDVTTTTGVFVWSNCIEVKGKGIKSSDLPRKEGL